jgi:glucose/arabinose dehydrogenase
MDGSLFARLRAELIAMRRKLALLALLVCWQAVAHAATVPSGFTQTILTGVINTPTAMAMAPDGRIFVCQQNGALRVVKNDALLATPFVSLTVNSAGERGLLGVAFDPDFLTNHYLYVYYTATTPAIHNRISRFTAAGDVAVPGSEYVLFDFNNLTASNHNGGALHFGRDRKLYAAVGENAVPSNSQTLSNLLGKMHRLNNDGSIPIDNPFYGTASGVNRSIWALGLRNPFTFGVHPISGRIFIDDVGEGTWEEINDGMAGGNYGWPATEGPTNNPSFITPTYYYANANAVECAIAGGTFYAPEIRQFPASHVESYFFSDLCGGWIHRLDQAAMSNDFASAISGPVDLLVGHDGSLYWLDRSGTLGRIRWSTQTKGDVNGDGATNDADAFYLANFLFAGGPAPVQGGDVDGNGAVNASDLNYLVAYLLGRGPTPA